MKTMKKLIIISILLIAMSSCTSVSEDDLIDAPPQNVPITYDANIKSIIDNNCIQCHSSPPVNGATIELATFNDVTNAVVNFDLIGRISIPAGNPGAMPFGGPQLPQNLIDEFIEWQNDGFPIN